MSKVPLLFALCILPLFSDASDAMSANYSVSTMYTGSIGKSNITINLITSKTTVSGSYMHNKYKNKILLNGVIHSNSIELKEKTNNSTAVITLTPVKKGYTGKWCGKECVPIAIQTNNSFREGNLKKIMIDDSGANSYKINLTFSNKNESVIVTDAIDPPSLEFADINNDGFYDLVARTDHRPNNGSQTIYTSEENGFFEDKVLSKENGTFVYNPYGRTIIFNSKDDCCNNFNKVIYSFDNGQPLRIDQLSFDYAANKGKDAKGNSISKNKFEAY